MNTWVIRIRACSISIGLSILVIGLIVSAAACSSESTDLLPTVTATQPSPPTSTSQASKEPEATRAPLKLLKIQPDTGYVGASFSVTGEGLPPNQSVDLMWGTWDATYSTNVMAETVEYVTLKYKDQDRRAYLGKATTDAQGRLTVEFTAPEDYGGVHDIYVIADGQDVARGGFQIQRSISISPKEGPLGTPITISMTGLGKPPIEHAFSARYDNQYMGFITGITTRGMVTARIRAAGEPGIHTIEFSGAGNHGGGYLNNQQSPYARLFPEDGAFRTTFTVTEDLGAPAATAEWPEDGRVMQLADDAPRTTLVQIPFGDGLSSSINPTRGPIHTPVTVTAGGLLPGTEVEMRWMSAKGNRVTTAGWELIGSSLGTAVTAQDGTMRADIEIPDGLGGWHTIAVIQNGAAVTEIPFYVQRSLVGVTPTQVREGEQFSIQLKGIGWTELDNTVAVTYDNAYLGYACGFNSNGDLTLQVTASGGLGTHLIDIYPTTFQGKKATGRWGFQMPQLTGLEDHPGLGLGYDLPVFRLAIEVIE